MASAAFFSLPYHGHTYATLPIVEELVRRGERVIYYSKDEFAPRVVATGAECRIYPESFFDPSLFERPMIWTAKKRIKDLLDQELERLKADRPSYVILDEFCQPARWVAEALGLPEIWCSTTFILSRPVLSLLRPVDVGLTLQYFYERTLGTEARERPEQSFSSQMRYRREAGELDRAIRLQYGLKGPDRAFWDEDPKGRMLHLVTTSRYFQPFSDTFDEGVCFVGRPLPTDLTESAASFGEAPRMPLVYVSLGTSFNLGRQFFDQCFDALSDYQVVMTTGGGLRPDDFEHVPENVSLRDFLPHSLALETNKHASVFITHGGLGSVSESMLFGVPVVVIPQIVEQAIVGRRVEQLGAGVCLNRRRLGTDILRFAVERVQEDEKYRENSERIGDSLRRAEGASGAVDRIFALKRM